MSPFQIKNKFSQPGYIGYKPLSILYLYSCTLAVTTLVTI